MEIITITAQMPTTTPTTVSAVTDAAGGEITTIDRDSRFNLILRVADYGAYNNFIPADQISARINSSAFTFTGNAEVGQLYEETDANGAGYYSYVLLFRDVIYNGGGNTVPINLSYLDTSKPPQPVKLWAGSTEHLPKSKGATIRWKIAARTAAPTARTRLRTAPAIRAPTATPIPARTLLPTSTSTPTSTPRVPTTRAARTRLTTPPATAAKPLR